MNIWYNILVVLLLRYYMRHSFGIVTFGHFYATLVAITIGPDHPRCLQITLAHLIFDHQPLAYCTTTALAGTCFCGEPMSIPGIVIACECIGPCSNPVHLRLP